MIIVHCGVFQFVIIVCSVLVVGTVSLSPDAAHAQVNAQERRVSWRLPSLAGAEGLRLVGYQPATTLRFTLPASWQPTTPGQLTLAYRISPATLEGPAYRRPRLAQPGPTLSLRVNGQSPLSAPVTVEAGAHTFAIPAEQLQAGPNELKLSVFLPLKDDPQCLVADDPKRWLELVAPTELVLTLVPNVNEPKLAEFPWHFAPVGEELPESITFVLPDVPNSDELQALSSVTTALAQADTTALPWDIQAESTFQTTSSRGPVVLIGDRNRNRLVATTVSTADREAGSLHLARPAWAADYPVLVVTSPNASTVASAAAALLDPIRLGKASSSTLIVADPPRIQRTRPVELFTLADLGYGEESVKGTGIQSIAYTFDQPIARSALNGTLNLRLAHSQKLGWSHAPLTVYLNEQRIANVLFDDREQSTSSVEIPIPAGMVRSGRNTLRLEFNLSIPPDRCGVDTLEGFWASVDPKSTFELPHRAWNGYVDLHNTPFQFTNDADLADLAIVLPSDGTLADVAQSLPLLRVFAQAKKQVAPQLVRGDSSTFSAKEHNLIILGDPVRQPLLRELNPFLPAPLDLSTGTLQPMRGLRVPLDQSEAAVVQGLRSPWAADRAVLVAVGDTAEAATLAAKLLAEPASWKDVQGNVAVAQTSRAGAQVVIASQHVANIDALPGVETLGGIVQARLGPDSTWLALGIPPVGMLLVAAGCVLGLRWDRLRKARRAGGH